MLSEDALKSENFTFDALEIHCRLLEPEDVAKIASLASAVKTGPLIAIPHGTWVSGGNS